MTAHKGYITRQAKRLSSGEINRRRFVMQALSAGVTMPTATLLASRAEAAQPRRGGVLKYAVASSNPLCGAHRLTGNTLTELTLNGVIGELATQITASENSQVWNFALRKATFQSGRPLSENDVAATFEAFFDRVPSDPLAQRVSRLETSRGLISFRLHEPDDTFAERLADPRLAIRPVHRDTLDKTDGTGPYRLRGVADGVAAFSRFDAYWKDSKPYFDKVEMIALPNAKDRQSAILNADAHVVEDIDLRSVALLQRMPNVEIVDCQAGPVLGVALSPTGAHLAQTLSAILPREAWVEKVLLGHGRPIGGSPDLAAAHRHFEQSGHIGPIHLAADDAAFPGATNAARLAAVAAHDAGIDIKLTDQSKDAHAIVTQLPALEAGVCAVSANRLIACVDHLAGRDVLQHDPSRLAERGWFL